MWTVFCHFNLFYALYFINIMGHWVSFHYIKPHPCQPFLSPFPSSWVILFDQKQFHWNQLKNRTGWETYNNFELGHIAPYWCTHWSLLQMWKPFSVGLSSSCHKLVQLPISHRCIHFQLCLLSWNSTISLSSIGLCFFCGHVCFLTVQHSAQ